MQIAENLRQTFPAPVAFTVTALTATGTVVVNPGFDGVADTNLLQPASSTLAIGAEATLTLRLQVTPNGALGPFDNTVLATGQSGDGVVVSDSSVDGMQADPDGNGVPDEASPTPIVFARAPSTPATIPGPGGIALAALVLAMLLLGSGRLRRARHS